MQIIILLYAMKLLSRNDKARPQDKIDLVALFKAATDSDLKTAREAVHQIVSRGTHRGRPLVEEFEEATSGFAGARTRLA